MSGTTDYIYWDANVFCHYVAGTAEYLPVLDAIFEQASRKKGAKILTSALSITEVAFASGHGRGRRVSLEEEERIDELWRTDVITVVDVTRGLLMRARELVRNSTDFPKSLKPPDAIHLATALWTSSTIGHVIEVHTYDSLSSFAPLVNGLVICKPRVDQPMLPLDVFRPADGVMDLPV